MLTDGADPVRKISIIPRGLSLGVTFSAPDADRFSYERRELLAKIKVALGGRAAEEIVYGEPTTGAESDIQQLTEIARQMVGRWGMSDAVGPLAVLPTDGRGPFLPGAAEVSEHTQQLVDDEVRRIVDEMHEEVVTLLRENRGKLDSLAQALLEHETLDEDDAYAAAGVPHESAEARGDARLAAERAVREPALYELIRSGCRPRVPARSGAQACRARGAGAPSRDRVGAHADKARRSRARLARRACDEAS